jgi:hypothetical protein
MSSRSPLRWFLNVWVIGGALVVAIALLAVTLALLWYTRPNPVDPGLETAVLNVIRIPTSTPQPPTPQTVAPSSTVPPSPPAGEIAVNTTVKINGTGGDGLRLRADPSLDGRTRFLAMEAEVFLVEDGPQETEGYTWWFLVSPSNQEVRGWAVANYLEVVQSP